MTYQCSVNISGTPDSLRWRVLDTSGGPLGASIFGSGSSPGSMDSIATQFNTSVTSNTGSSIVSDITFIPTMSINNYTVQCAAVAVSVDNFTPVTRTCPIMVEGKWCIYIIAKCKAGGQTQFECHTTLFKSNKVQEKSN